MSDTELHAKFQMARIRNDRSRKLDSFLTELQRASGISRSDIQMVEVEDAYQHRQRLNPTGTARRNESLTGEQVRQVLQQLALRIPDETVRVFYYHHDYGTMEMPLSLFIRKCLELVEFDGDTVYAAVEKEAKGIGLDRYEPTAYDAWAPTKGKFAFELDFWGTWSDVAADIVEGIAEQ